MPLALNKKIRALPITTSEETCFSSLLGNETLPKERVPAINLANAITSTTGNQNDTGVTGSFTKAGFDSAVPNLITSTNLDSTFYNSLVTESELSNKSFRSTNIDLIKPSMVNFTGQNYAALYKTVFADDTATASVKHTDGAFGSNTVSTAVVKAGSFFQNMAQIDLTTEIGMAYEVGINVNLWGTYKSNFVTTGDFAAIQRNYMFDVITIGTITPHIWVMEVWVGPVGGTETLWRQYVLQEDTFGAYKFPNSTVGIMGQSMNNEIKFPLPVITSTQTRVRFRARVGNWDAYANYTNQSNFLYSQSARIDIFNNSNFGAMAEVTGWKSIITN